MAMLGVRAENPAATVAAAQLEACLTGALDAGGALLPSAQVAALKRAASLGDASLSDAQALDLGRALGARLAIYAMVRGAEGATTAEVRVADVEHGGAAVIDRLTLDDLPARCADEARRLATLSRR
jgi:hypothetical protein